MYRSSIYHRHKLHILHHIPLQFLPNLHHEHFQTAEYYNVYYGTDGEKFSNTPYKTNTTSYYDSYVFAGDTWYYYITAVRNGVESKPSYTVYGQKVLTCGRWSDVTSYSNIYELEFESSGSSVRSDTYCIDTEGYYVIYWFPVSGGTDYTIKVYDLNRNSSYLPDYAGTVNVTCFPAGNSDLSTSLNYSTNTVTASLTGYYVLKVYASKEGYYKVSVQ